MSDRDNGVGTVLMAGVVIIAICIGHLTSQVYGWLALGVGLTIIALIVIVVNRKE